MPRAFGPGGSSSKTQRSARQTKCRERSCRSILVATQRRAAVLGRSNVHTDETLESSQGPGGIARCCARGRAHSDESSGCVVRRQRGSALTTALVLACRLSTLRRNMPLMEILGLLFTAAAGGAINAIAGGGTLLTFPTLLFFGTPPVVANATSTMALVLGTSGSLYGYRQHLPAVKLWLWRFVPISLLGGLIGGVLLTLTSNRMFSKLIPFLILFATLLFLGQGLLRRLWTSAGPRDPSRHVALWGAILFQFAVAIYGGYFGAGIGILMLVCLGFIGLGKLYEMNTLKTLLT